MKVFNRLESRCMIGFLFLFMLSIEYVIADELLFAPLINDGVVLQRDMPVNIWGSAVPGEKLEILLNGKKQSETITDNGGKWLVVMQPHSAGGPYILKARTLRDSITVKDVYFGEVWLAAGQSNMVQNLNNTEGGKERLATTVEELRFVIVPQKTGLPVESELTSEELSWKTFTPRANNQIAAVAFFFAEYMLPYIGCKIGIIQSSYGATPAQAWTPLHALDACPELKYYGDFVREGLLGERTKKDFLFEIEEYNRWNTDMRKWRESKEGAQPKNPGPISESNLYSRKTPVVLYENMIKPLIPFTARGVIWYQGEGNAGKPDEYRILFPAMINAWREAWNRPDWPFFFVQLSAFSHPVNDWPALRAVQAYVRDTLPFTGMAITIDKGEKDNIHPRYKQPVGERLARLALAHVYGKEIVSRGPVYNCIDNIEGEVIVNFNYTGRGLQSTSGELFIPGFELAASDSIFYPAKAEISSLNTIKISSEKVDVPAFVRYGWHNWIEPPLTLINSEGLPAEPFLFSFLNL